MIKLRLQRKGRKKRPFYHIVVADSRAPRDGRIIERLGRFDNVSEKKELTYDEERIIHWLKIGAKPSDTVRSILKGEGILYKMHLMRWGKSDEEIEAALEEWRNAKETRSSEAEKDVSRKTQQKELLKAEEKEFKQQVEEKAAAAAKELEKKKEEEAKAKAEAEAEAAKAEEAASAEAETEEPEEAAEEKTAEAAEEETPAKEEKEEAKAEAGTETPEAAEEEPQEQKTKAAREEAETEAPDEKEETEAEAADAGPEPEPEEEEKEEAKAEETPAEEEKEEASAVSTDMNATEAIDHIKNTPIEDLEGFVPEKEDRVTVQRAWESKQSESES